MRMPRVHAADQSLVFMLLAWFPAHLRLSAFCMHLECEAVLLRGANFKRWQSEWLEVITGSSLRLACAVMPCKRTGCWALL